MSPDAVLDQRDLQRRQSIAAALCAEWRMFERVTLVPAADGAGFHAKIHLNPTIVRGSIEQQGLGRSSAGIAAAEARRAGAIAQCVEQFNAKRSSEETIRDFEVAAWSPG